MLGMLGKHLLNSFQRIASRKNVVVSANLSCPQLLAHLSSTPEESQLARFRNRKNETVTTKKARLLYQSRKRGMLENDLLLSTFASKYLQTFDTHQLDLYDKLINLPSDEWDIYYWATEIAIDRQRVIEVCIQETPSEFQNEVMEMFKKHVSNENREPRFRQPDL